LLPALVEATSVKNAKEKQRKGYLTWLEAADEFNVSPRCLKYLAKAGKLTRYKMHGLRETLLSREELSRVLEPQPIGA
jgi:hypothetical protein